MTREEYEYLAYDATPEQRELVLDKKYNINDTLLNPELFDLISFIMDDIRKVMVHDG